MAVIKIAFELNTNDPKDMASVQSMSTLLEAMQSSKADVTFKNQAGDSISATDEVPAETPTGPGPGAEAKSEKPVTLGGLRRIQRENVTPENKYLAKEWLAERDASSVGKLEPEQYAAYKEFLEEELAAKYEEQLNAANDAEEDEDDLFDDEDGEDEDEDGLEPIEGATLELIKEMATKKKGKHRAAIKELMIAMDVKKLADIPEEEWPMFLAQLTAL